MPALFVLFGALMTWAALYQGILAYVTVPPPDTEFATVTGLVRHVDTPVTRNRFVPSTELQIETRPARQVRLAVRRETLDVDAVRALRGRTVTAIWAAGRPRNRWVYGLAVDGRTIVAVPDERARDEAARRSALAWMAGNGSAALLLFIGAWRTWRRRAPLPRE